MSLKTCAFLLMCGICNASSLLRTSTPIRVGEDALDQNIRTVVPTDPGPDPVEVARERSERSLPTGLEGQEWFWKKLSTVTSENKEPLIPDFKVESSVSSKK